MWANKEEIIEYATRVNIKNPDQYATDLMKAIEDMINKGDKYIPEVIDKGDDSGKFIFEAWGSVEVVDKDNQVLPISDILKAMPLLIKRGGTLHLGHTNQPVGRVLDFWVTDYKVDGKYTKGDDKKVVKGIKFKAELFDDFKSDAEARKGVLNGDFRMVSLGGKSHKGIHGMAKSGEYIEIMKDLEVWEFALVRKGKNPLAWVTHVNGVEVHKGDDEGLYKDEGFMRTVHSLLLEGIKFNDAWSAAKDILNGAVPKSTRKPNTTLTKGCDDIPTPTKGDKKMPEDNNEEKVESLEKSMKEFMEETKALIKTATESFDAKLEEVKKSIDIPGKSAGMSGVQNPPPAITKGEENTPGEVTITEEGIAKAIVKGLSDMGFTTGGIPKRPSPGSGELKKGDEDEDEDDVEGDVSKGLTQPDSGYDHFKANYQKMMSETLNKGKMAPSDVPSFAEMGASLQGIPISKGKGGSE